MRTSSLVLLVALIAGCTSTVERSTTSAGSTSTDPSETSAPTTEAPATTAAEMPEPSTTIDRERAPLEVSAPLPTQLLLVDSDGVWLLGTEGELGLLVEGTVETAFDDREGGIVFQAPLAPSPSDAVSRPILRLRAGADLPEIAVHDGAVEMVSLIDVVTVDGEPNVLYTSRFWAQSPWTSTEILATSGLTTGRLYGIGVTGGWEAGIGRASYGGDLYAINGSAEASTWLRFLDTNGAPVEIPTNPNPEGCFDDPACPWNAVISPDGLTLLYTHQIGGATELVELFLYSGAESTVALDGRVIRLDYDGRVLVVVSERDDRIVSRVLVGTETGWVVHPDTIPGWASIIDTSVDLPPR